MKTKERLTTATASPAFFCA